MYQTCIFVILPACQEEFNDITVDYITMPGWSEATTSARHFHELPAQAQAYVKKVEELLQVPGTSYH